MFNIRNTLNAQYTPRVIDLNFFPLILLIFEVKRISRWRFISVGFRTRVWAKLRISTSRFAGLRIPLLLMKLRSHHAVIAVLDCRRFNLEIIPQLIRLHHAIFSSSIAMWTNSMLIRLKGLWFPAMSLTMNLPYILLLTDGIRMQSCCSSCRHVLRVQDKASTNANKCKFKLNSA